MREVGLAVFALLFAVDANAAPTRRIPENNLAYPALITTSSGSTGSGFYLATNSAIYLVTAAHVVFANELDPKIRPGSDEFNALIAPAADLVSYGIDPKDTSANKFHVDLPALQKAGLILRHEQSDVAVARIFALEPPYMKAADPAVQVQSRAKSGIAVAPRVGSVVTYDDVMVSNEVIVFGYPTSIGLAQMPQFDYARPLLRSGIVAGKYDAQRTIILDCPVYPGNSGGPVIGISSEGLGTNNFLVIGVVTQFVPLVQELVLQPMSRSKHVNLGNSGYSIAAPMDPVFELLDRMEARPATAERPTAGPGSAER
jgi:S1-C subfamily serine protease